jgi:GTP-binding protein
VLELILQADVAIVGKPSVGKSSLLATITRAKPQIGGYPFTTTHPVLGTRELRDTSEIWLELPALIAGAHEGRGLGNSFLRHAMAARLLFLMLDGASEKLLDDYFELREELAKYNSRLSRDKPQILAVNKCDLPEVQQRTAQIQAQLDSLSLPIFFISAKSGEGVLALLDAVEKLLKAHPTQSSTTPPLQSRPRPTIQPPQILKSGSMYAVKYRPAERLAALSNSADWRVLAQLRGELKRMSVGKALERAGVRPGDKVRVGRALLEW